MNIFKVLANGYGSVNENNISAFMGYLLDPKADHGLGYTFINDFVKALKIDEFIIQDYDIEVFFEQEFISEQLTEKKKNKIERVDILIVCSTTDGDSLKNEAMLYSITNPKQVDHIFLIENKIKSSSVTKNQIKNQRDAVEKRFREEDILTEIHSIYLTPEEVNAKKEFKPYVENKAYHHVFWVQIIDILKDLINKEHKAEIDPISNETRNLIKAFIQFIDCDFKSEKQQRKESLLSNISYDFEAFSITSKNEFSAESLKLIENFTKHIANNYDKNFTTRHSKTHPCTVLYKDKKIMSLTKRGKKIILHFVKRNFKGLNIDLIKHIVKDDKVEIREFSDAIDVYDFNKDRVELYFDKYVESVLKNSQVNY